MKTKALALLGCLLIACLTSVAAHAQDYLQRVQASANPLEGTWRSGRFAFTFSGDGQYVYVGEMGNQAMNSHISERGTWRVSGNVLLVTRASGVVWTSQNYRRDLPVETTEYHWQIGTAQGHLALQLIFPNGQGQIFYKE